MLLAEIRTRALASLIPPPRLRLSEWIEHDFRLPEGVSAIARPGAALAYQREIAAGRDQRPPDRARLVTIGPLIRAHVAPIYL
jgi:hypothetical protein